MSSQRFDTREKAAVEVYGKPLNIIADLKNISKTGACLERTSDDIDIDKGDLIRVTVILKALNRKHNISAEVVWREGKKTGINFIPHDQVLEKLTAKDI